MSPVTPLPASLGLFCVGLGAVSTTLMAGVELARRHGRLPVGSYSQLGWLAGPDGRTRRVAEVLGLAPLDQIAFGAIDLVEDNALASARNAGVLGREDIDTVSAFLSGVEVGPGIHNPAYAGGLPARHVRPEKNKAEQARAMSAVFREFFRARGCARGVVLLTLSTEAWRPCSAVHASPEAFLAGLQADDPEISPSQIYAWAAIDAGYPVVNCTPNAVLEAPAIQALAAARGVAIAGSDLKSGQTYMKTVIGAALGRRLLGVKGWFSTNILGNRDGFVLNTPENFRAKEISKGGVLSDLLDADAHPELYADLHHQVHIHYFPPKGDDKEAWDSIQLFGWMGYPMEIKVNFQCRDSILAAPLVLDLALFTDLAARRGEKGVLSWLGGYFKAPASAPGETVCNDPHRQLDTLEAKLRSWA